MRYQVYRQLRMPDGTQSVSLLAVWPDGSTSHEEITIDDTNEGLAKASIRKELADRLRNRPKPVNLAPPKHEVPVWGNSGAEENFEP